MLGIGVIGRSDSLEVPVRSLLRFFSSFLRYAFTVNRKLLFSLQLSLERGVCSQIGQAFDRFA
jgi:hypothetical protein